MKKPFIFGFLISLVLFCSCDPDRKVRHNPLIDQWADNFGLPPFNKIVVADYEPALAYAAKTHLAEIEEIADSEEYPVFENVILPLDSSGRRLRLVGELFALAGSVSADGAMDSLKVRMAVMMAAHEDAVFHNAVLFDKVKAVYDSRLESEMDSLQLRLTEKTYLSFVRNGAALTEADKAALGQVNEELAEREALYGINFMKARNETFVVTDSSRIDGLTYPVRTYASALAKDKGMPGKFALTMEDQIADGVLMTARDGKLREEYMNAYEKLGAGDSLNGTLAWEIVRLRSKKAGLLGYGTYAAYNMPGRMAGSPVAVYDMLDKVWKESASKAQSDEEAMLPVRPAGVTGGIKKWDWDFYLAQVRKRDTTVDQEQIEQYMSLVNVRLGAFELCNRLFGLTFRPVPAELYDADCEAYEVFDVDNSHLGIMIFDYYARPGKQSGAWTQCLRDGWPYGGDYSDPVTCSAFNLMKPTGANRPTLLSFTDVEEMFRQVGNAVEIMLADTPYAGLQGLEPDLAGITGEMMAYWAFEPQLMFNYALHYSTGNQLSEVNLQRISGSRNYRKAYDITRTVGSAYLDMDVHMNMAADSTEGQEWAFERASLYEKHGMPRNIGLPHSLANFVPVFGSSGGAGYYGRLWAGTLGADIFDVFKRGTNLFDRGVAGRFREEVLSRGSGAPADTLYRNFRGRGVSLSSFLVYNGLLDASSLPGDDKQPDEPAEILPADTIPAPVPALELWKNNRPRQELPPAQRGDSTI